MSYEKAFEEGLTAATNALRLFLNDNLNEGVETRHANMALDSVINNAMRAAARHGVKPAPEIDPDPVEPPPVSPRAPGFGVGTDDGAPTPTEAA
jgi:hypothetical protein